MLAKGREKSLLRRHPWIFSGAVARVEGKAALGETIDIVETFVTSKSNNCLLTNGITGLVSKIEIEIRNFLWKSSSSMASIKKIVFIVK